MTICNVPGTFTDVRPKNDVLWQAQTWQSKPRPIEGYGHNSNLHVTIRFDDQCGNGVNTFSVTAEVPRYAAGCLHDDIATVFPELAPLLRWHLVSSDGPMHYIANTVYHASDRDVWGKRAGQPNRFAHVVRFGDNPIEHRLTDKFAEFLKARSRFQIVKLEHPEGRFSPKFTFKGFGDKWHEGPFDTFDEARHFLIALHEHRPQFDVVPVGWSEGKARNLDAARASAVWPETTDEELCAEPEELKARLDARLPALIAQFRADIEAAGLRWSPNS